MSEFEGINEFDFEEMCATLQASSSEAAYFLVLLEPLKTLFLSSVSLSFFIYFDYSGKRSWLTVA